MNQVDITKASNSPACLFDEGGHTVYWLGIDEPTAFRANTYLIRDVDVALLVNPGNRAFFPQVRERVAQILPPEDVRGMIVCHPDPDVAASMIDWLTINPAAKVYTTPRSKVLLKHYGRRDFAFVDVEQQPQLTLPSGAKLRFIPAPFLHFPGAFATLNTAAKALFSGDVVASLDVGSKLLAEDFEELVARMMLFHVEYMASNIAARGFVQRLAGLEIQAILPQHGCIIPGPLVAGALHWLEELRCGTDILYPELSP